MKAKQHRASEDKITGKRRRGGKRISSEERQGQGYFCHVQVPI